jgi:hypothetical protein
MRADIEAISLFDDTLHPHKYIGKLGFCWGSGQATDDGERSTPHALWRHRHTPEHQNPAIIGSARSSRPQNQGKPAPRFVGARIPANANLSAPRDGSVQGGSDGARTSTNALNRSDHLRSDRKVFRHRFCNRRSPSVHRARQANRRTPAQAVPLHWGISAGSPGSRRTG